MKKWIMVSFILLIFTIFLGVSVGSSNIELSTIYEVLKSKVLSVPVPENIEAKYISIIWVLRFPRVLLAIMVGGALAVSGSATQSVLRNPLASPYTLGVSTGASLGAALVMLFHITIPYLQYFTLPIVGLIGGLITVVLVLKIVSILDKNFSNQTVILVGIVLSLFVNAVLTLTTTFAHEDLKSIIMWQMGSLSLKSWNYVIALFPFFIVGIIGICIHTKELDALSFGEQQALSLGVDVARVKKRILLFSALLAGSSVAISGVIGFIGLVAPHIVRRLFGAKHSYVIPLSIVFGGIFLIITDLVSRTILSPIELPVGSITAFIGAPFFAFVFFSNRK